MESLVNDCMILLFLVPLFCAVTTCIAATITVVRDMFDDLF